MCEKNDLLSYSISTKKMAEAKKNYELNSRKRGFAESWKTTYKWVSHKSVEDIYEENGMKKMLRCK